MTKQHVFNYIFLTAIAVLVVLLVQAKTEYKMYKQFNPPINQDILEGSRLSVPPSLKLVKE